MRVCRLSSIIAFVLALGFANGLDSAPPNRGGWMTDFAEAQAEARRLDRPILVHFYADWCGPCKKMEAEVLNSRFLVSQFGTKFIGVKVNTDHNRPLAKKYGVEALPCDLFLDPAGKVLAQTTGYQDPQTYLTRAARIEARYTEARKVQIARTPLTAPVPVRNTTSTRIEGPQFEPQSLPAGEPDLVRPDQPVQLVGLSGYSPISLWNHRKWVKGQRKFAGQFKGILYYMADEAEQAEFNADPEKYAPRLLGCDPVVLAETDRAIPGSTRFAAYFGEELYVFVSSATRDRFRQNPQKYVKTRHVLRLEQLEGTALR